MFWNNWNVSFRTRAIDGASFVLIQVHNNTFFVRHVRYSAFQFLEAPSLVGRWAILRRLCSEMIFYVGTKLLEWRFLISSNRITEVLFDNSTALNSAMQRATKNFIEYFCVSLMQPKTVKKTDSSHKHTKRWKAHAFERQFAIGATSRTNFWHFDRCSISAHKNHLPNFFSFISVVSFVFHFCCENTFCSSSSAAQWISFPSYLPSIKWMWIKRIVSDRIFNWSKSCFFST